MKTEDYQRLLCRMNEVRPEDDSAVLVVQHGEEITVSTFGEPMPLMRLKQWMYKWLGGRER